MLQKNTSALILLLTQAKSISAACAAIQTFLLLGQQVTVTMRDGYSSKLQALMQKREWRSLALSKKPQHLRFHQRPLGGSRRGGGTDLRLPGLHGGAEALQTQRVQWLRAAHVHAG